MINPTKPIIPVKETTEAIIKEPIIKIRILNLPVFIPRCKASSSPRAKAFRSKEEVKSRVQPTNTGMVMILILYQLAVERPPINQKTIECNSLLEKASRIVINAEKRKVIATPAKSRPIEPSVRLILEDW